MEKEEVEKGFLEEAEHRHSQAAEIIAREVGETPVFTAW